MALRDKWEPYLMGVISKDIGGLGAHMLRGVFRALSYVYTVAVQVRVFLYNHRLLRSKSLGCLVISVGNITVGGTGKTPVVEMIARQLIAGGRRVAILSRGYKSNSRKRINKRIPRVISDGEKILEDVGSAGDEPYMLARQVPRAVVLVDKNRVRAANYAIKEFNVDTVILDDGYQYLELERQVNMALIDCTNPFGIHRLLPRGILREPVKNLNRANIFFLTKTKGMDLYGLKKKLQILNPKAEIVETSHQPLYINDIYTGTKRDLKWLAGKRAVCVSGIASPEGFEKALIDLGVVLVGCYRFSDHHVYQKKEIQEIVRDAAGKGNRSAQILITTQKDAVRFPRINTVRELPMCYLRVEIEILSGVKDFYDSIDAMHY